MIEMPLMINPKEFIHNAKNIFFDLDETLIHTNNANNFAYNEAAKLMGLSLPQKERITKIHLPFDELTNIELVRLKNQCYQRFIHLTTIDNVYLDLLIQYRKFSSCFIISAGQIERVISLINYHKLQAYFKEIYTSVNDKVKFINDRFQHTSVLFDTEL